MSATEQKVRKVRVKKSIQPGFKGRLHRLRKTGYISNLWYWYLLLFLTAAVVIFGITFCQPSTREIKGNVMDKKF